MAPPPPACPAPRSSSDCLREASSCLAARHIADSYSFELTPENRPIIIPLVRDREDDADKAAEDCADGLRQCLVGGC
jgi:hypothetical protein